jgi:hypothetical protein
MILRYMLTSRVLLLTIPLTSVQLQTLLTVYDPNKDRSYQYLPNPPTTGIVGW